MFECINFCKESINGEVIFMFVHEKKCDYLFLFQFEYRKHISITLHMYDIPIFSAQTWGLSNLSILFSYYSKNR